MRWLQFIGSSLLVLLLASVASAQPMRIYDNGAIKPLQYKLNFIGPLSCNNNTTDKATDCTWTGAVTADSPLGGNGTSGSHLTCTGCLTGTATTTGDIFYSTSGGNALSRLAAVSTGALLGSQGTSSAPAWVTSVTNFTLVTPTLDEATSAADTAAYLRSAADTHGTAITPFLMDYNTTAATVGAQKVSRGPLFCGGGWKTQATAGSQPVCYGLYTKPVQGVANPSLGLTFFTSINSTTSFTDRAILWYPGSGTITWLLGGGTGALTTAGGGVGLDSAGSLRLTGGNGSSQDIRFESNNFFPTAAGQINIGTGTFPFASAQVRQFVSNNSSKPTCTVGAGAGTGATCALIAHSSQNAGAITVNTGSSPTSNAMVVSISNLAEDNAIFCTVTPYNLITGQGQNGNAAYYVTSGTTTGEMFTIVQSGTSNSLTASTTYQWAYTCMASTSTT